MSRRFRNEGYVTYCRYSKLPSFGLTSYLAWRVSKCTMKGYLGVDNVYMNSKPLLLL